MPIKNSRRIKLKNVPNVVKKFVYVATNKLANTKVEVQVNTEVGS